ncbi:DNA cytosine methyltransferase [Paracidovorax wautersii]|uniref:DNA cytosine methyltransferase n=1 Tax=Paracidovorax wautersii TaxID=1177982 RepID=UPI0031D6A9BB
MKRDDFTLPLAFPGELIIDNFAGGGGTSTGLESAFGRPVDIAINHDPEALAMHALNHPHTQHLCESVWDVDPIEVTRNQPVALVWLSPDCKHFSKAKGGTPVAKHIRGLAWVGMRWAALCKPRVLMLENVEEFQTWGPLLVGADGLARPDPARKGKTFQSFVRQLRGHGYTVDWRELRACDHGAPTIRKRLFLIARRDGLPITWPAQTHAEPTDRRVLAGQLAPHRTAAECIDFDLPAESVFGRKRPLVDNTMRRVAKGLMRHVLSSASPFIVGVGGRMGQSPARSVHSPAQTITAKADSCVAQPVLAPYPPLMAAHITKFNTGSVGSRVDDPLPTITAGGTPKRPSTGIQMGMVGAHLVTVGYGERAGQEPRTQAIEQPLGTAVAGGIKQAVVQGHLVLTNTTGHPGAGPAEPLRTVTTGGHHALVAAHLVDMGHGEGRCGTKRFSHGIRSIEAPLNTVTASGATSALVAACLEQANGGFYEGDGRAADAPMSTITAAGSNQRVINAYLVKYYGMGENHHSVHAPTSTITSKDRLGLVQTVQMPAAALAPEHAERARLCAALLHEHLPGEFTQPADMVLMQHAGQWWVLVDITLRMLKPRELYRAQGFPAGYLFEEIPDPALLFHAGQQATSTPLAVPRIPLSTTAQVRMCGNSVSPPVAEALVRANFAHESAWMHAA